MSKYWRYHIVSSILIFLFGAAINMTVFCPNCLNEPYFLSANFFISVSYNGLAWTAYWKGSEFLVELWDKRIPWIDAPIKRFFVSFISITVYVFLVVWGLDLFFDLVVFGRTLSETLEESGAPFGTTLVITLVINIFMHGRGFLFSWRQAAIDVEKLRTEQVSTQYESLKNQVNPHFLFNSLNALTSLVYDDQEKAVEFIRKLSQVYRYVLDKKDEELVPFEDELDFARNYIFLQKIRFGDNLKIQVIGAARSKYVPPLAIQLLVENAIKHNVVSELHPLTIDIEVNNDFCIIRNSIKEKLDKDSTGVGLDNLKARYQYLSKKPVEVANEDGVFTVKVPLLKIVE